MFSFVSAENREQFISAELNHFNNLSCNNLPVFWASCHRVRNAQGKMRSRKNCADPFTAVGNAMPIKRRKENDFELSR